MRHNAVRDLFVSLARECYKDVECEPVLQPIPEDVGESPDKARADGRIRSFWYNGTNTYFDVGIVNTSADSYVGADISRSLELYENRKKDMYAYRILNYDFGTFSPLIFAASGARGKEAESFMKCLAAKLSHKKSETYSTVASLLSIRLSFAIQRAAVLCIRGSHTKRYQKHVSVAERDEVFASVPADVLLAEHTHRD